MTEIKNYIEKYKSVNPDELVKAYYDIQRRLTRAIAQGIDVALMEYSELDENVQGEIYLWSVDLSSYSNNIAFMYVTEEEEVETFFTYKLPDDALLECAAVLEILKPSKRLNVEQEISHWFKDSVNIHKIRDITGVDGMNCFYNGEKFAEY